MNPFMVINSIIKTTNGENQMQIGMVDVVAKPGDIVDIQISINGRNMWVNVNSECVFRMTRIESLKVNDERWIDENKDIR
jgi:hypothetical protein